MSRRIKDPAEAAKPTATAEQREAQETAPKGVTFIKNHLNEIIHLPNGGTYQFRKTRETITDQALIEAFRDPAIAKRYGIFE